MYIFLGKLQKQNFKDKKETEEALPRMRTER